MKKLKQWAKEIKHSGLAHLIKIKKTEQYYKHKLKNIYLNYPDIYTNIETLNGQSINKDSRLNQGTAYYAIKKGIEVSGIDYSDITLLDIGCGYGKTLNFGMLQKCKQVIGIDLDVTAVNQAIANCSLMKKNGFNTPFSVHNTDASQYTIPENVNVIFMANPFGKKTMEAVAKNIIQNLQQYNKEIYIIYFVPVHQDVYLNYKECTKVYESFTRHKKESELVIFKVTNIYQYNKVPLTN